MPEGMDTISTPPGDLPHCANYLKRVNAAAAVLPIDWQEFGHASPTFITDPFSRYSRGCPLK